MTRPAHPQTPTLDTLMHAEEIIITNSGALCGSVTTVDGQSVGGRNPSLLKRLHDLAADEMLTYVNQKYR